MLPLNLELLILTQNILDMIGTVEDPQILEQNSKAFNEKGLFSTTVFGPVGTDERMTRYGRIDFKVPILHPLAFKHITSLSSLYKGIFNGTTYAKFDNKLKNFIPSDIKDGDTGYDFFIRHMSNIQYVETESKERSYKIKLIKKYTSKELLFSSLIVLPAGLRDYMIDKNDKPTEDEINPLYRKLLNMSTLLQHMDIDRDTKIIDPTRYRIQLIVNEIYDYIIALLDGKSKFIQGKWTKRPTMYGTRNVLTGLPVLKHDMFDKGYPTVNHTIVGLYQVCKAMTPITRFHLKDKIINKIFHESSNDILVYDKTYNPKRLAIDYKIRDRWTSNDGIDSLLSKLGDKNILNRLFTIDNEYPVLVYDDGDNIKYMFPSNPELPEGKNRRYLRPATIGEMIYYSVAEIANKYPNFVTRYPVANTGGIYPSQTYLKSTVNARRVNILDDFWNVQNKVSEYPKHGENYFNSISANVNRWDRMGADADN